MSRRRTRRLLAAVAAGVTAGLALVPLATSPVAAAPAGTITMGCQTSTFPGFDWAATVDAVATTDGTETGLTLQLSNMPGIAPVPINNLDMAGSVVATVNGTDVTLTGTAKVTAAANSPVPVPPVTGRFTGTATSLDVTIKSVAYTVAGLTTKCPVSGVGAWPLSPVVVTQGVVPTPTPTPTPSSTPTASPTATPTATPTDKPTDKPTDEPGDKGGSKGKPAQGKATFACTLAPLSSDFEYATAVTVTGKRAEEGDKTVNLAVTMDPLPGIAPVPIVDGGMNVSTDLTVGGEKVTVEGHSTVNAAPKETVPMPTQTGTVSSDEDEMDVGVTAFAFAFDEMAGLTITADCTVAGGGSLSRMGVGVGAVDTSDESGSGGSGGTTTTSAAGASSTATLPKTGGADALPVVGLWALALMMLGSAALLLVQRRTRPEQ